jgi:hypothetical protein
MDSLAVQCLRCHTSRIVRRSVFNRIEAPECPACGYLGWIPAVEASERDEQDERSRVELRLPSVA